MRQVLPTKPLTSAILYGPGCLAHWKNLVLSDQGLKHSAFAPGPETTFGPAQTAADDRSRPAIVRPVARATCFMPKSSLFCVRSADRMSRGSPPADAGACHGGAEAFNRN